MALQYSTAVNNARLDAMQAAGWSLTWAAYGLANPTIAAALGVKAA